MIYTPFISSLPTKFDDYKFYYSPNDVNNEIKEGDKEGDKEDNKEDSDADISIPDFISNYVIEVNNLSDKGVIKGGKREYIKEMLPIYEKELKRRGIDTRYAKYLLAQDGLESAWGSKLTGRYNYGGIKSLNKGRFVLSPEWDGNKMTTRLSKFKDFSSKEEYVKSKIDLLSSSKYKAFSGDIKDFAIRVKSGGYATDPNYISKLNNIIRSMKSGGILKYKDGNTSRWLKDYYYKRRQQLGENVNSYFPLDKLYGSLAYNSYKGKLDYRLWDNNSLDDYIKMLNPKHQYDAINRFRNKYGNHMYLNSGVTQKNNEDTYIDMMKFRRFVNDEKDIDPTHLWSPKEIYDLRDEYKDNLPNELKGTIDTFNPEIFSEMLNNIAMIKKNGITI